MAVERDLTLGLTGQIYGGAIGSINSLSAIDSHTPNSIMMEAFKTSPKVNFSSFIIPNQSKGRNFQEVGIIKSTIGQAPTTKVSFTFPTFKEKYYIQKILFDGIVEKSYINIKLARSASSISVSSLMVYPSFTSRTYVVDFEKIWKIPLMIKAEDTLIIDITLPDEFLTQGITKTLYTIISYSA